MCIVIACFPVCDIMILKLILAFLSTWFPTTPKKSGETFKYIKNEKNSLM